MDPWRSLSMQNLLRQPRPRATSRDNENLAVYEVPSVVLGVVGVRRRPLCSTDPYTGGTSERGYHRRCLTSQFHGTSVELTVCFFSLVLEG